MTEPEIGRGFVAVVPPDDVLDAVDAAAASIEVPSTARRTTRPQWHLTLQFLGNKVDFAAVTGALEPLAVRGAPVQLGTAGAFPSERRGRVLWLGVREGNPLLVQLTAAVGALLAPVGYAPEARPYHAHLTLARLKAPADLRAVVAALGSAPVGRAWTAGEVVLFRSKPGRGGSEYTVRARVPLG
ncbi:MAG TPA: RNA 2',3'-cyclic phosphodiesterase [Acidimicrobiia bacterium]|nr:RNA 2',3'-cyclic phosphodiesterase [Acidimicrobiia bacterium]